MKTELSKNANKLLRYLWARPNGWQIQLKDLAIKLLPEEPEIIDLTINELTEGQYIKGHVTDDDIWLRDAKIKISKQFLDVSVPALTTNFH